ncbi:MAG TPA: TlpA disulfide reductase family protein [Solirubrobacteraceae bacterium]|nr:TlpA disulfide reductase family protein [Solirubrobacteraceae bacterium]
MLLWLLAAAALVGGLAACGGSDDAAEGPAAAPARPATTAAAPGSALARNAAGADRIVGSGRAALERRMAALEGHPVVVNQWASWCGPCRHEFPFFARAVERHGDRIAFLGIDYMDGRDAAQALLEERPPGFPSIFDRDGSAARAAGGGRAMPTTLFVGPDGKLRYSKLGGYATAADLEADIRRYALRPRR